MHLLLTLNELLSSHSGKRLRRDDTRKKPSRSSSSEDCRAFPQGTPPPSRCNRLRCSVKDDVRPFVSILMHFPYFVPEPYGTVRVNTVFTNQIVVKSEQNNVMTLTREHR